MELPILPRLPGELKAITFGDDVVVHHSKMTADWRLRGAHEQEAKAGRHVGYGGQRACAGKRAAKADQF
jgi:ribosomal protein L19E